MFAYLVGSVAILRTPFFQRASWIQREIRDQHALKSEESEGSVETGQSWLAVSVIASVLYNTRPFPLTYA